MGLTGKTILITRASAQAGKLRAELEARGARVLECPTIEIRPPETWTPVDEAVRRLDAYDWLLLTSTNAVDSFFSRVRLAGVQCNLPIAAVGSATEARLAEWNVKAAMVPRDFHSEGLLEAFPRRLEGIRILFPRAQEGRDSLPEELRRRGAVVDLVPVYRTVRTGADALTRVLASERVNCIVFASPSAIDPRWSGRLNDTAIAVIGPLTRGAAEAAGLEPSIQPERATIPDLAAAIDAYYSGHL